MKAFLAACIGIVVISFGAKFGLDGLGMTADQVYSLPGVSLPDPDWASEFPEE